MVFEDKLARTLAEMENQRRRYEKEKEDAFEYGGFSFARESLNLIDNFLQEKTYYNLTRWSRARPLIFTFATCVFRP